MGPLTIEVGAPVAQPEWLPAPSQVTALERAREAWPAVLEVKAAVFEQAVAQLPPDLSAAEREARLLSYRDRFQADCADAWQVHTSQHLVTGAAQPHLERDVLARHGVDELVLGAPSPHVEPGRRPASTTADRTGRQSCRRCTRNPPRSGGQSRSSPPRSPPWSTA